MESITRDIVRFSVQTGFSDLPDAVRHEAKRILLDSVGCALAGLAVDKGKFAVRFARGLGVSSEATILGASDKVSSAAAAFANGELVNALDMDAVPHVPPFVIPAPLALGEGRGSSGKDLIVAIALGHEIAMRLKRTLLDVPFDSDGKFKQAEVGGFSATIIGGTIGVGNLLHLGEEKTLHAVGLAGHMAPVPAEVKWRMTTPSGMDKYLSAGWVSLAEVTAVLLAEMGYTGDTSVLDGDYGLWKFFGAKTWQPQKLLDKLGAEWHFLEIMYKPYACCRIVHGALDCFIDIIEENQIEPEEIDSVRAFMHPMLDTPVWRNTDVSTHIDAQFSVPYIFAVAAHRIPTVDWQEPAIRKDSRVLEFMKKVSFDNYPEFGRRWLQNPKHNLSSIEVVAKGQTFKREKVWAKGDPFPEEAKMKDEELEAKFRVNTSKVLGPKSIDRAMGAIFEMEKIHNMSELLAILSPNHDKR